MQDGKKFVVERYRKHANFKDQVFLVGGDELSASGRRSATNEEITHCLGMTYEMFLRSVMWAQGTAIRRLTQLTDVEYKLLFDELIGTEHYLKKVNEIRLRRTERASVMSSAAAELRDTEVKIQTKQEELAKCGVTVEQKQVQTIRKLWIVYGDGEHEIAKLDTDKRLAASEQATYLSGINNLSARINDRTTAIRTLDKYAAESKCSQCGQILHHYTAERHVKEKREKEFSALLADKKARSGIEKQAAVVNERLMKIAADYKDEAAIVGTALAELRLQLGKLGIQIEDYAVSAAEKEFENLVANRDRAAVLRKEISKLESKAVSYRAKVEYDERAIKKYEMLERAYGPAGMRMFRLIDLTPMLNSLAKEYSQALTGGALQLNFSTTKLLKSGEIKEKYSIDVETTSGAEFSLSGGGMTRRADLIAALALDSLRSSITGKQVSLKVYDEATDGLDASGEASFVALVREECADTSFFVSHKSLVSENCFDDVMTVRKKGGVSEVV
jgi:DNA repair exonuclease SbcCD ATPase subunit